MNNKEKDIKSLKENWINDSPSTVCMCDAETKYIAVSDKWLADFNLERDEIIGRPLKEIFPEMDELWNSIIHDCLNGHISTAKEIPLKRTDGSISWLSCDIRPWHNECNEIGGIIMLTEDVSEQMLAKEQLIQSEKQYRDAFEYSPVGMSIVNIDGTWQKVNKKLCETLGYSKDELYNLTDRDISHPEDLIKNNEMLQKLLTGTMNSYQLEKRYIHKNGSVVWVDLAVSLVSDSRKRPLYFVKQKTDISERKITDENSLKHLDDLNSKINELRQFTYIASHDLKEPINTIESLINLIREDDLMPQDGELARFINLIYASTKRMQNLIKDLREYSRLSKTEEFDAVNLNDLLGEVNEDLALSIQEAHAIINIKQLPFVNGSRTHLRILFQNLISNAIKFQKINVQPVIEIGKVAGEISTFYVKDNGIGVEEKYYQRIFHLFQRLHQREVFDGTGIGLSSCKKIVELHKGEIWIESTLGVGTTFYFTLNA